MPASLIRRVGGLALMGSLAVTGVATARPGDRSFTQTYPVASALCARTAAGHPPPKLAGSVPQVEAACSQLQAGYSAALAPALAAEATFKTNVAAARAQADQTCAAARAAHTPRVCRQARRAARLTVRSDRLTRRAAVLQYRIAIESGRRTFWSTIHALRGGSEIKADAPHRHAAVPSS